MAESKLAASGKQRLADILYGQILEQIVAGKLEEGDRLPSENQICQTWSVSRPTVREALMRLQADGLVITRQGSGTYVRKRPSELLTRLVAVSDVAGLLRCMEVRNALEGQAAGLAAQRRTPAQMDAISQASASFAAALEAGGSASEADFGFHIAVADASGNGMFVDILDLLGSRIKYTMTVNLGITQATSKERARRVLGEHQAIVEAIARGDTEIATLTMRYHLHCARQRVIDGQALT